MRLALLVGVTWPVIVKPRDPAANLVDYDAARRSFDWSVARREIDRQPGGGLNLGHAAVDRHVRDGRGARVALRWRGREAARDVTYAELAADSSRFASALTALGVGKGEVVFALCPRVPELYAAALGTFKHQSIFSPLFPAFGPDPIATRIGRAEGVALVTTAALYQRKVAPIRDRLPSLRHVILVGEGAAELAGSAGLVAWHPTVDAAAADFAIAATDPETPALLHFTSGTTGRPKGALHVHAAVVAHHATARLALDLRDDDVFFCTADPGWVTGTSYGIIAPLTCGVTSVVDDAEFDAERWYRLLADERVTVFYTAPTAIRMLMRAGPELARRHDLSHLRFAASVGEPLAPDAVVWGQDVLGVPFHDNWWQTETGGIAIANFAAMDIRPGSMGKPLPGIVAGIVQRGPDGEVRELVEPDQIGELALRPGWPSMFRGYLHDEDRYRRCFADGWYLSGDLARRDADGYYWFVGRADDLIKSSGHLIGPFEVESALLAHPAVAQAGVIGLPHPVAGEVVKAIVVLKPGFSPDPAMHDALLGFARQKLGPAVAPREIGFAADLPRTRSGKILRRLLRARELGLPEGDTSTLESTS